MKKLFFGIAVVLALGMMAVSAGALEFRGNDLPKLVHSFKLNIIGVGNDDHEVGVSNGCRMFVALDGSTDIKMMQLPGSDFMVTDPNGLDGEAVFNIGDKSGTADNKTTYLVFARPLGKPGKSVDITVDIDPDELVLFLGDTTVTLSRDTGKPKVSNITRLFYVKDPLDPTKPVWVFNIAEGYLWVYDNHGLKLMQVWFFEGTLDDLPLDPNPAAPSRDSSVTTTWGGIKG